MSEQLVYEASVYSRNISYRNFKGEISSTDLYFALDPLTLMQLISSFEVKAVKSGNPARAGKQEISEEAQLKFIRNLASKAAGFPSEDGETWEPFEDFENTLVGKAFLTKLTSSDGDRREFAEKVVLAPFEAFVNYAKADPSNSPKDTQEFETMLQQMRNIFKAPEEKQETLEERRARLAAELAAAEAAAQNPAES